MKVLCSNGIFPDEKSNVIKQTKICKKAIKFLTLEKNFKNFITYFNFADAMKTLNEIKILASDLKMKIFLPRIQEIISKYDKIFYDTQAEFNNNYRINKELEQFKLEKLKDLSKNNTKLIELANKEFDNGDFLKAKHKFMQSKEVCINNDWSNEKKFCEKMIKQCDQLQDLQEQRDNKKDELNLMISGAQFEFDNKNFKEAQLEFESALNFGQKNGIIKTEDENKIKGLISKSKYLLDLNTPKEYHGLLLNGIDYSVLNELEIIIGTKIPIVSKISWDCFGFTHEKRSITGLGLYDKKLDFIPKIMTQLNFLKILNIGKNCLTTLPDSIGNLKSLQILKIFKNQLSSLSDSIGNLNSLKVLDLNNNQLCSLPDSLGNLNNLENLYLQSNRLYSLPENIGCLKKLLELYLFSNNLTKLPDSIIKLTKLKILYLSNNELNKFPRNIENWLTNLEINCCSIYR